MDRSPERSRQYATFAVGGMFFGIEVLKVQEVLRFQEMTPVPLAPSVVEGLINLRGQIVTAIDMRRRLGIPSTNPEQPSMNMVIRTDEGAVSLLVDSIGDVLDCSNEKFEDPPENLPAVQRALINEVYKLNSQLLLVLNTEAVLET